MVSWKRSFAVAALAVTAISGATSARAEVSANPTSGAAPGPAGSNVHLLVMEEVRLGGGFTEDPNPVGLVWIPLRAVAQSWLLNPNGGPLGDRRPDTGRLPDGNRPVSVWAHVPGPSSDVAFAEWGGIGWLPTELLTDGSGWHWDPRIHIEADGTVHVVWWEQSTQERILLRTRPAGSAVWDAAVQVSGLLEMGRRPSVTVVNDRLWVVYERDSTFPGASQELVVAVEQNNGSFNRQVVAVTPSTEPLHASIDYAAGHLWVAWRQKVDEFYHGEWDGAGWSAPVVHPWSNYTWLGLEEIRLAVRRDVLP